MTNTSGQIMDFLVSLGSFYIDLLGKRYVGHDNNTDVVLFNDFNPGDQNKKTFAVDFAISWKQFALLKASSQALSYKVGVADFGQAIPQAQWEYQLCHGCP